MYSMEYFILFAGSGYLTGKSLPDLAFTCRFTDNSMVDLRHLFFFHYEGIHCLKGPNRNVTEADMLPSIRDADILILNLGNSLLLSRFDMHHMLFVFCMRIYNNYIFKLKGSQYPQ